MKKNGDRIDKLEARVKRLEDYCKKLDKRTYTDSPKFGV